ncbi:lamin tail domain-containing protein [Candidatus Gracilibacteria bacterium]|nr:lamin tail domain-containing protein [Candidatus Gracilibacteria bacterium]
MIFGLPFATFASVEFFALLPNPIGDDTVGEYIEIRNTSCQSVNISGYHLYDASNKTYVIPTSTIIPSHENIRFLYATTKIALNNSGNESITLTDMRGTIIDTESYSGKQLDNIVIYLTTMDESCSATPRPIENNTGTMSTGTSSITEASTGTLYSNTGNIESGSGAIEISVPIQSGVGEGHNTGTTYTGSVVLDSLPTNLATIDTNTGTSSIVDTSTESLISQNEIAMNTGTTSTGTIVSGSGASDISWGNSTGTTSTGTTSTGTTSTGTTSTGTTSTGTTASGFTNIALVQYSNIQTSQQSNTGFSFPEIIPTQQQPTNAIFTGGIWDCGTHQPCRINITFDPIFTGSFHSKNYICEVITATGTLTTCNPNTLYFTTPSSFSLRLTSKVDPSQSKTVNWGVSFMILQDNSSTQVIDTGATISRGHNTGIENLGIISTGAIQDSNTQILEQSFTGVTFPEIIPTFQNYTNITHSGNILTCTTSPCRVNFTLDPIFTGSYLSRNYICEIRYGTGVYDSCNPPQLYLVGTGGIDISLTHKGSRETIYTSLLVTQNIVGPISAQLSTPSATLTTSIDTNPPIVILEYDGKLKGYHEQVGDYEMNCYSLTCAINLTADRSYDPEGDKVRFLWYYGSNDIKITKDPGERKYGLGDHEIWLRVMDTTGNVASIRYHIHVLGPKEKEEKIKTEKKAKTALVDKNAQKGTKKGTKKKKSQKITFFDPPNIFLQNSKFIETDGRYICRTTAKSCSFNLALSGTLRGLTYTWTYDDGQVIISKNPKSKSLTIGAHTIVVTAAYGTGEAIWTSRIYADVSKIKKLKKSKIKKPSKKKLVTKKKIFTTPVQLVVADPVAKDDTPYAAMALIGGIMPILILRRILGATV